jgi:hypothetical protein
MVGYGWVGGQDRELADWELGKRAVIADQARRDFRCEAGHVTVEALNRRAFVATGCGRRGVYLIEERSNTMDDGNNYVNQVWLRARNVTTPSAPPPTPAGSIPASDGARGWVELVERGAHDLACPAEELTPDFVPQGRAPALPVVEGCGKRATYLSEEGNGPFRLSAIVAMDTDGGGAAR